MREMQIKCSNIQTTYRQGMRVSLSILKASLPHLCFNLLLSLPFSSFVPIVFCFPSFASLLILILPCICHHIFALSTLLPHNSAFSLCPGSSPQFLALHSSLFFFPSASHLGCFITNWSLYQGCYAVV